MPIRDSVVVSIPIIKVRSDELIGKLKEKKKHVKGRCHECKYLIICVGNFRAGAESVTGGTWAPDPACYLTDEEIGIK